MIKAVIFDLDDTLLMTRQTKYEALKYAAKHFYDLTVTDDEINEQWGKPFQRFISDLYHACDNSENISKNYKSILHLFPNKPYAETIPTLDILQNTYKLGILSTADHYLVHNDLRVSGVGTDRFEFVQTEDDTNCHKPDPKVFEPTLKKFSDLGFECTEMMYVGDMFSDFLAASGAGLSFVGIPRTESEVTKFKQAHVPVIQTLAELPESIRTYEQSILNHSHI